MSSAKDAKRRRRTHGRKSEHSFLGIPHYIVRSPEFGRLDAWSVKLLIELAGNYNGKNNGDLSASFKVLKARGWRSPGTLDGAKKRLVAARWLVCTREGGRNHCSLYAVTWWPIDYCPGKWQEVGAETVARHSWKSESVVGIRTNVVTIRTENADEGAK